MQWRSLKYERKAGLIMGMVHTFTRGLLAVGLTGLVSSFAMGQTGSSSSPTAGKTGAATAPAAEADAGNDKAFNTLAQETSIKRSINKHGNVVEEVTVSTTSRRAMNAALHAIIKERFKVGGQDLTVIRVRLPETMTMTADPRGQDFIFNPAEKSEAGPNKEITVYYPLVGFELSVEVRRIVGAEGPADFFGDTNIVRRDIMLKPSTTPGEGLQLGLLMKSVSRADLSDTSKLEKFRDSDNNSRVFGFSAVDSIAVQQCSRREGSGVLGTSSHMITSNLADFANFVQTSMPKHFDTTGTRSTVGLDHAIWGSAAKAIAVKTLMVQDPSLEAAAARKMVEERFVGYVLSSSIPEAPLIDDAGNVGGKDLDFRVGAKLSMSASSHTAALHGEERAALIVILK